MVKSVEVKNFKSISDLKIELGRVNVFIGENGSGKSNILEAVAFGAAASANKLDKEFLASRGMRVPEPKLMRSAFSKENLDKDVQILFRTNFDGEDKVAFNYMLGNLNEEFSEWNRQSEFSGSGKLLGEFFVNYFFKDLPKETNDVLLKTFQEAVKEKPELVDQAIELKSQFTEIIKGNPDSFNRIKEEILKQLGTVSDNYKNQVDYYNQYKIYAPENTFLRKFEDEDAGDPLGIKGEGLFRLLRYFQNHENKSYIESINEALSAFDWFESFDIPNGLYAGERRLSIIDRFLDSEVVISQNSANEGFLFILFYISLFVSGDTPPFFAIDNIDASFNPKLCKHITQTLINTAKKTNKQALFTTHNPFILDGLNLTDDEQRLFVVYRTQKGHTIAKRIEPNDRKMKLSEQWMEGLLGGLPKNF